MKRGRGDEYSESDSKRGRAGGGDEYSESDSKRGRAGRGDEYSESDSKRGRAGALPYGSDGGYSGADRTRDQQQSSFRDR